MTIDWTHFTPYASLAGGVAIGVAAALLLLFIGIHNAWDTVSYYVFVQRKDDKE